MAQCRSVQSEDSKSAPRKTKSSSKTKSEECSNLRGSQTRPENLLKKGKMTGAREISLEKGRRRDDREAHPERFHVGQV